MQELKVYAPTYYGDSAPVQRGEKQEFDDPRVPVLVRPADGIRIVLGSHDYFDCKVPDVQIERRPNGWAIFLHPVGGCDACGYVYFLDDGRSFLVPENGLGATPVIELLRSVGDVPEIDEVKPRG
ncbi:MAG: hypothetical protein ABSH22_11780 [Tepidisphaeraceae bacterium]